MFREVGGSVILALRLKRAGCPYPRQPVVRVSARSCCVLGDVCFISQSCYGWRTWSLAVCSVVARYPSWPPLLGCGYGATGSRRGEAGCTGVFGALLVSHVL